MENKRNEIQIKDLRQRVEQLERQLSGQQTKPTVDELIARKNYLKRIFESREQEFRSANDTISQEIQFFSAENAKLKRELYLWKFCAEE